MNTRPNLRLEIIERIKNKNGQSYVVGGYVRDMLMFDLGCTEEFNCKDIDIEVYGLSSEELERTLSEFGEVDLIGKSFGTYKIKGYNADFSLPRKDYKIGEGHKGFNVLIDPFMKIENALKRRDLTINSIALNPLMLLFKKLMSFCIWMEKNL